MSETSGLRLTAQEIAAIKRIVAAHFGADAQVRVFGSRTRPEVLGGDLDLHVLVPGARPSLRVEGQAVWDLEDALDGLPVDLVVTSGDDAATPFERQALRDGVRL